MKHLIIIFVLYTSLHCMYEQQTLILPSFFGPPVLLKDQGIWHQEDRDKGLNIYYLQTKLAAQQLDNHYEYNQEYHAAKAVHDIVCLHEPVHARPLRDTPDRQGVREWIFDTIFQQCF